MRILRAFLAFVLALVFASPALAQGTSTAAIDAKALKEELRRELRDELLESMREELRDEIKDDIKNELQTEGGFGAVQEDSWAEEEWKWEEPVRPELNFFELDGYFRFRYEFFHNPDLDVFHTDSSVGPSGNFSGGTAPTVPICNLDPNCTKDGNSLGGANMRLRLEPVFNVYEDIKIKMQVDALDNIVLGSTPDGFPKSLGVPLVAFSGTQLPPSDGVNALTDSIRVKRVWAEVMTPLGQLRFGRMPSHFGMGLLANEGRGIDSDYGDSQDRIMFATKIAGHYIVPGFDWAVSGPTSANRALPQGQPFDRSQRDDVDQFFLAVAKRDKEQDVTEMLENDEAVFNYGTYVVYRKQAYDSGDYYAGGDPTLGPSENTIIARDAWAWVGSVWLKLMWRKLLVEFEGVGIYGKINNSAVAGNFASQDIPIDVEQMGGALNVEYKFLQDSLTVGFLTVLASGDSSPGWGALPLSDSSPRPGAWDGAQQFDDGKITNFRIDPDFRVDLLFWRQMVGTITDAMVFRPSVQYNLTEGLGARLDVIYSRAFNAESTMSGGFEGAGIDDRVPDPNLGIETDLKVFYASDDGFHAWLQYGIFFPFAGLNRVNPDINATGTARALDAGIAQTIRAMLAVTF